MATNTNPEEYIAALYPGLGARFIDFKANTVAVTEKSPIRIEITIVRGDKKNCSLGSKIKNMEVAAARYKSKETKKGFSAATNLNRIFTKKYPINAMKAYTTQESIITKFSLSTMVGYFSIFMIADTRRIRTL